ncbi:proliferating cell nuclear antigen (pcna) [Candidatus Woesearchaeota archaeon]|nr:MAG: proliferating cell nuclear antigen (pcna) [Candidatus Woesearchaeota archaeon]
MKLTLAETKYLTDSVSIISDLVNEASFKVTPTAVELVAMDPANVAMVIFKLLGSAFTEYKVEGELDLSINLPAFKQVLKRAKATDVLTMEVEDQKLKLTLKSNTKRTFYLPILDKEGSAQRIPDLSFPTTIVTDCSLLNDAIQDADIVAESVSFIATPQAFILQAEEDLNRADVEIPADDQTKITTDSEEVRAKYSIEYLKKMITASKLTDKVQIQFNKDYPLRLDYSSLDKLSMSFILAPRVEND